jgi:excisionase family DNA binding protein
METSRPAYTPEQVAARFGLQAASVRKMLRNGTVPARKFGRAWRIEEEDLEKLRNVRLDEQPEAVALDEAAK